MPPIYLDHNASTPTHPAAWEAMRAAADAFGNPASAHRAGKRARQLLEDAREQVAALLGASPDEVLFTSGATEANNLALFGLCGDPPGRIVSSAVEHPCVTEPLKPLAVRGFAVELLPVDRRGIVSTDLPPGPPPALVAVMLANHETGAIQPVRAFTRFPVHCDAAQAVGKIPVRFRELGVVSLAASAHKFGGPKGVGLLLLKKDTPLRPRLFGGHQQRGHRPGTEPVPLTVGLAAALSEAVRTLTETGPRLTALRQRLLEQLEQSAYPVVVNGPRPGDPDGLPTTLNVSFPGCRADLLLMALDLAEVACGTGSACSSGSLLPSPVLTAMRVPDDVSRSAMRFSLGPTTTAGEIDTAAGRIIDCVRRLRGVE